MRILAVALLLTVSAHAQVTFEPSFEPEHVDRFRIEATLTVQQEGEEAIEPRSLSHTVDIRLTTAHVDASGRAIVSLAFDRVDVTLSDGDREQHFRWPTEDEGETDLALAWSMLADDVLRVIVNPDGRIRGVEGVESLGQRLEDVDEAGPMLGLFAPDVIAQTLTPIWAIDPAGDVRTPGDEWIIAERRAITGQRRIQLNRTYVLDALDEQRATMTIASSVEMLPLATPTQVDVSVDWTGEGAAVWNLADGIADEWGEESTVVITASLQDIDPITTRLTRQVSLTRVPPE